jgi:hypothetical protein
VFNRKFYNRNQGLKCSVPSCGGTRDGTSLFCKHHANRTAKYGDPLGGPIPKKEFTPFLSDVSDIVNKNLDHPGILQGLEFFTVWLRMASQDIPCPALQHMKRLAALGVPAFQLLKVTGAAYWFTHSNPNRIPTVRARAYFVANQLFRTVHPGGKVGHGYPKIEKTQPTGKARREAGEYVHEHLTALMANIVCACLNKEKESARRLQEQYAPLRG